MPGHNTVSASRSKSRPPPFGGNSAKFRAYNLEPFFESGRQGFIKVPSLPRALARCLYRHRADVKWKKTACRPYVFLSAGQAYENSIPKYSDALLYIRRLYRPAAESQGRTPEGEQLLVHKESYIVGLAHVAVADTPPYSREAPHYIIAASHIRYMRILVGIRTEHTLCAHRPFPSPSSVFEKSGMKVFVFFKILMVRCPRGNKPAQGRQ